MIWLCINDTIYLIIIKKFEIIIKVINIILWFYTNFWFYIEFFYLDIIFRIILNLCSSQETSQNWQLFSITLIKIILNYSIYNITVAHVKKVIQKFYT